MYFCINRNIVECKDGKKVCRHVRSNVLIETLWNVKSVYIALAVMRTSINRNIVECKGSTAHSDYVLLRRINRNIVECKDVEMGY